MVVNVALACDLRLMETNASFQMVQAKRGISPGWGGAKFLTTFFGRSKAIKILCAAQKLSAEECLSLGVADRVFSENNEEDVDIFLEVFLNQEQAVAAHSCKQAVIAASFDGEAEVFDRLWRDPSNSNFNKT